MIFARSPGLVPRRAIIRSSVGRTARPIATTDVIISMLGTITFLDEGV
ncbi:hypothetical protein LX90_003609 [Lentzea flava]|nr:hypothetical protein [Lentzea flava]